MGYEDRDYYQQESWEASAANETHVTKWFVILTVAAFVWQALLNSSALFDILSLKADAVYHGQVWRLLTFVLCHHSVDIIGLVFSLLIIWRFGTDLERMYGSRELFMYYVAMTLFIGGVFCLWRLFVELPMPLSGSFTVALGLLALFATHYPRMEVYILPLISIQLRWLVAIYALFGLYPALQILQAGGGLVGLAYASSILGVAFALLYRKYDWHLASATNWFQPATWKRAWRTQMGRRRLRVYKPATEVADLETKVDALLAKIHEHGSESLTPEERDLLMRASERMKNRQ